MADNNSGTSQGAAPTGGANDGWKYGAHVDAVVYQCSGCGYSSLHKTHVHTHQKVKCPAANVLSRKCTLPVLAQGQKVAVDQGSGAINLAGHDGCSIAQGHTATCTAHNNSHNNNHNTINLHVHLPAAKAFVGSAAESDALAKVFKDPELLKVLKTHLLCECPEDFAASVFNAWKGPDAPEELHNIRVVGDRVEEQRGPDTVTSVPRSKFIKDTLASMLKAVSNQMPDDTPAPEDMQSIREAVIAPVFSVGKKRKVSRLDAAKMHAVGAREVYALDADGREFLACSKEKLANELNLYTKYCGNSKDEPASPCHPDATATVPP